MTDLQRDHRDPVWYERSDKTLEGQEQLVCGFDIEANWRDADISDNSRKSDRFLPYRLVGDAPAPCEMGDVALFLVGDEWVELEWLGDEWYEATTNTGRYHQARQGRLSAERQDGYIGWRQRQDEATQAAHDQRRIDSIKAAVASGKRWGAMLPEHSGSAEGGKVGGPRTATATNAQLREMRKVIVKDSMTIACEPGVIATRIVESILAIDPEAAPMSPKDVHRIWAGKTSKGWQLLSIG